MSNLELFPVVFVGAGPGSPDLITVAGRRALEQADLVVYAGSLVSREMLDWTGPGVELVDSASLDLEAIVRILAAGQRAGGRVVRLHTGDPCLYGAIREQMDLLDEAGIPYRVIPGVTAAFAAAAALGLEFTLPETTQTLVLTRAAGRTPVPEKEDLKALAAHGSSLAVYLSAGLADRVREALEPEYGPDEPLAVVYKASWPDEKIIWTTVARLAGDLAAEGAGRQALILAGPAVSALARKKQAPKSKLYDAGFSHGYRKS
ncbi:MAG: precorrin-4 C(11)-methyltransferase [Pseudomonadota bacterium]